MKILRTPLFLFIALMLLYSRCQEHDDVTQAPNGLSDEILIEQAQRYFQTLSVPATSAADPKFRGEKTVMWDEAFTREISVGKAVFVPMRYNNPLTITNSRDKDRYYTLDNFTNLVIYQDKQNVFHAEQIIWLADAAYQGLGTPFTGILKVHDWQGNLLNAFNYNPDGTVVPLKVAKNVSQAQGRTEVTTVLQVCVTTYGHNYSADDPIGYYWSETNCEIFVIDGGGITGGGNPGGSTPPGGGGYGGGSGSGGGGGSGGTKPCTPTPGHFSAPVASSPLVSSPIVLQPPPPPMPCPKPVPPPIHLPEPPQISIELEDPCLKAGAQDFLSSATSASTQIFDLFGTGDLRSMHFEQGPVSNGNGGHDWSATSTSSSGGIFETTIRLDNTKLVNTTKEFIASTIIHEAYHAWYDMTDPANSSNDKSHELMSQPAVFNQMVRDLMSMFPGMSQATATSITWTGLEETAAYKALSAADQANQYNTARDYRYGAQGTKCN